MYFIFNHYQFTAMEVYMPDYKKKMGHRLSLHRKKLHLTQEQVAEILNISVKHYSELERGLTGISVDMLILLSNKLSINIDYLLKGDETKMSISKDFLNLIDSFSPEQKLKIYEIVQIIISFNEVN